MNEQTLQNIIKQYFLTPNETINKIELQESEVVISTGLKQWFVTPCSLLESSENSNVYELYEIEGGVVAESPSRPDGVAVLPEQRIFRLNDEEEFKAFWQQIGHKIEPLELAELLARYQGKGPYLERHQNLIVQRNDLIQFLDNHQIDAIGEFTLFQSTKSEDGVLKLQFCTFYIAQEPPDYIFRLSLNRWEVEQDAQGRLLWSVRPIAQKLDSPFYSPKSITI